MNFRNETHFIEALQQEIELSGLMPYKDWLEIDLIPSNQDKTQGILNFNFNVRAKKRWACECQLHIRCNFETINNNSFVDGCLKSKDVKTTLGWSSTSRTIAQATDAINLYSKMRDLACSLEATIEGDYWKFS